MDGQTKLIQERGDMTIYLGVDTIYNKYILVLLN